MMETWSRPTRANFVHMICFNGIFGFGSVGSLVIPGCRGLGRRGPQGLGIQYFATRQADKPHCVYSIRVLDSKLSSENCYMHKIPHPRDTCLNRDPLAPPTVPRLNSVQHF